jgi:hypothetical protein
VTYLRFQGMHTDVFTVTLMEGDTVLAGPVNVRRGHGTNKLVVLCCDAPPVKFDQQYADGKETGHCLVVRNRDLAHSWLTA